MTFPPVTLDRNGTSRGLVDWQSPRQGFPGTVARFAFGAAEATADHKERIAESARVAEVARVAEAARVAEVARVAEEARVAEAVRVAEAARVAEEARVAAVAAEAARVAAAAQAVADAGAAASAAAEGTPTYTKYVWTSGWQAEIDTCQGAVDLTGNYGVSVIGEHWSCGGSRFPANGTIIALTGVRSGTYRVGPVVAILNANTERTDAIPRGYDLLYQTCINGSNATMSFTELTRVG